MATKKPVVKKQKQVDLTVTCGDCDRKYPAGTSRCPHCGYQMQP